MQAGEVHSLDEATIFQRFHHAVAELWARDRSLIERRLSELSVAHRLAVYLERQFPEFHTDCQYSRNSRVTESTYDFPYMTRPRQKEVRHNLLRQGMTQQEADAAAHMVTGGYPAIIVHRREENDLNLLVVELQLDGVRQAWGGLNARDKLCRYTLQGERGLYRYAVGLYVQLGVTDDGEAYGVTELFRDGRSRGPLTAPS